MAGVKKNLLLFVCSFSVFVEIEGAVANYGACETPNGISGDCLALQSCPTLYNLAFKTNSDSDNAQLTFLRNSQCGRAGKMPLVCCPKPVPMSRANTFENHSVVKTIDNTCDTPNGLTGTCISIRECSSLLPLVKENTSPKEWALLTRSQCGTGFAQVCCPDLQSSDIGELPLPPNCGKVMLTERIFGGSQTDIDEFPWTALIIYNEDDNRIGVHCGGSLINERYVVTAAHCVSERKLPSNWVVTGVRLGEWKLDTEQDCQYDSRGKSICNEHQDVDVEEQICHPLYNVRTQANDIALLRLAKKVNFNNFVQPICLPFGINLRTDNFENATMSIAGWGETEKARNSQVKLKAEVNGVNLEKCKATYRSYARIKLGDTQLCAGGEKDIDTCHGDSGGPLMLTHTLNKLESYFLVGVVSFGPIPCGQANFPGVYTKVGSFLVWIKNTIKK